MRDHPYRAAIFDLDGVLTRTAHLHARAWKEMFDDFLERRSHEEGTKHQAFAIEADYQKYVDGKPREDGTQSFLTSRGISLPEGSPDDPAGRPTIHGLGNRKNQIFRTLLDEVGPEPYPDAVDRLREWRRSGMKVAVVTSSRNGRAILNMTGLTDSADLVLDGTDSDDLGLQGKPAPDIFCEAARKLGVEPAQAIVIEDAIAGVKAARAGGFGGVIGVARGDEAEDLREAGADVVVDDLRHVDLNRLSAAGGRSRRPSALHRLGELIARVARCRLALFLDYDGTLTPIVTRPEDAILSDEMRSVLDALASAAFVAIVSGRDLADVEDKVGLEGIHYAGSHGFDIAGPDGLRMQHEEARESLPALDEAEEELRGRLEQISGAHVERKHFAIAIHYREAAEDDISHIEATVDDVLVKHRTLRKKVGKKIFELQPDVAWDKGRAVTWLLEQLDLEGPDVLPVYIGDDVTDEDAFEALRDRGISIRVGPIDEPTAARYVLRDTDELQMLLENLVDALTSDRREDHREMHPWELAYRTWNPDEQPLREALCALGNGHIVTRGAFEEMGAGGGHYPGTYVAGGYNRLESQVADRIIENEDLVNWPNWLPLTFRPEGGDWFNLDEVEILDFDFRLDIYRGLLIRTVEFRDEDGREFSLVSRRLVNIALPQYAAIEWKLKALNWSGQIEIRSSLDGSVVNDNVERYRGLSNRHLDVLGMGREGDEAMFLTVRTNQSLIRMTQAARTCAFEDGVPVATRREHEEFDTQVSQRLIAACHELKELRIEKVVAIRTSFDTGISEPELAARRDIRRAGSFADLLRSHEIQWRHLWSISDIELNDDDIHTQLVLRLHIFHLLQSTSIATIDRDVGVPARGWHGEAYRGHIFWDELFIFPLLTLRIPELTRALLMYRYRRLPEARHLAREEGFAGAMYPWQSGSDGREESQIVHLNPKSGRWLPDTTHLQRHVNAAIAYNVWEYYQATGDSEFMAYYGAEMLLEIARFWASIAAYDAERDRYVIKGVVGPDEFHTDDPNTREPGLNNNAYTNVMASWVLCRAMEVLDLLGEERKVNLREEIQLEDEELMRWDEISRKLLIPFHDGGIISQFEGYHQLEEFDWDGYRKKYGDIHRLDRLLEAEGDDVNRYRASKQADVLMLFYLLSPAELEAIFDHMGYEFSEEMLERNISYYMKRTSHGSTLSQVVHSWVLARRDRAQAWTLWQQALRSDIEDIQGGTTPEGIHLGAMAGTVDLIHRGHTGLVMEGDTLWFDPLLPEEVSTVRMRIRYRGHWLTVTVTQSELTVSFDRGRSPAAKIGFCGEVVEMEQGDRRTFRIGAD